MRDLIFSGIFMKLNQAERQVSVMKFLDLIVKDRYSVVLSFIISASKTLNTNDLYNVIQVFRGSANEHVNTQKLYIHQTFHNKFEY